MINRNIWQFALLIGAIASLIIVMVVLLQVVLSPYVHGGPARIVATNAGPYPLKVTFYADPASAGYALPFAIQSETRGPLTYDISARPAKGTVGSIVHGDINTKTTSTEGMPGSVNITVRGNWILHIVVAGSAGEGQVNIPFRAVAPPAIPSWLAMLIGLLPVYGIVIFLLVQSKRNLQRSAPEHRLSRSLL
jgi:hypothetical protein